ncbi:Thymocyte nuclear protein 1 [Termitomyces sp. J132]|nr:Thymocyte nuclear protein 1 [Termitomyces sp. J132]
MAPVKYWLLKAEPDSRLVKGKDVKFSVDDFESVKTSPWEGVRNYEARNLMKEMKVGEKALFYHSNCKNPGIAAFAEVIHSDQILPSHRSHPYYDAKTKKDDPRWFMVDLKFVSRATHFVPLALLRFLSDSNSLRPEINYIQEDGLKALKAMDLVGRGRLSVQRVEESAWNAIVALAEKGGWEEMDLKVKGKRPAKSAMTELKPKPARKSSTRKTQDDVKSEEKEEDDEDSSDKALQTKRGTKRKPQGEENSSVPRRRTRAKR